MTNPRTDVIFVLPCLSDGRSSCSFPVISWALGAAAAASQAHAVLETYRQPREAPALGCSEERRGPQAH